MESNEIDCKPTGKNTGQIEIWDQFPTHKTLDYIMFSVYNSNLAKIIPESIPNIPTPAILIIIDK